MIKFLVVGVQRSGTTFIGSSLDSHPQINYVGEIFKVPGWYLNRATRKLIRRKAFSGEHGYSQWMDESLLRQLGHYCWRNKNTQQFLEYFYTINARGQACEAAGFKLMSSQARRFGGIIPYVNSHGVKVIHIIRENVLKTHISRLTASRRSLYHSDKTIKASKITIPTSDLIAILQKINRDNENWRSAFSEKTEYLQVTYESFVKNKAQESHKMLSFLGVDYHDIKSSLVKINPDSLADIIENYNEVRVLLEGTQFEWML